MKKIFISLITLLGVFLLFSSVQAAQVKKIQDLEVTLVEQAGDSATIQGTWSAINGAGSYKVQLIKQCRICSKKYKKIKTYTTTATEKNITKNFKSNVKYGLRVKATGGKWSAKSWITPITTEGQKVTAPDTGCYTGLFPGWGNYEDNVDAETLTDFEALSGKGVVFVPFSNFWGKNKVTKKQLEAVASYGGIPVLRFMPWGEYDWENYGAEEDYKMKKIINGNFDKFLKRWAKKAKEFDKPMMVTFGVEMNGDWFPWSGKYQGGKSNGAKNFKKAYRRIVKIFRDEGVNNVTWLWHANGSSWPQKKWNTKNKYYPGDNYVDWIGLSIYGAQNSGQDWEKFEELLDGPYQKMTSKHPNKPLMLAEYGVREPKKSSKKATWYTDALTNFPDKYDKIDAIIVYHEKWASDSDLRINSSSEALTAFKNGIGNDYYLGEYQQ